jgi:hypothetical protein
MIHSRSVSWPFLLLAIIADGFGCLRSAGQISNYALPDGSDLTDDCLICDRLSLPVPLRGTFQLLPLDSNTLFARYQLTNIFFRTTGNAELEWESYGGAVQVERSQVVDGPYSVMESNVTAQALEDVGVLTKAVRYCYQLRQ